MRMGSFIVLGYFDQYFDVGPIKVPKRSKECRLDWALRQRSSSDFYFEEYDPRNLLFLTNAS